MYGERFTEDVVTNCGFGQDSFLSPVIVNSTLVLCVSPPADSPSTILPISLTSASSYPEVLFRQFKYYITPSLLNPAQDLLAPGSQLTIDGENLIDTENELKVGYFSADTNFLPLPGYFSDYSTTATDPDVLYRYPVVSNNRIVGSLSHIGNGVGSLVQFLYLPEELMQFNIAPGNQIRSLRFFVEQAPTEDIENFAVNSFFMPTILNLTNSQGEVTQLDPNVNAGPMLLAKSLFKVNDWIEIVLDNPIEFSSVNIRSSLVVELSHRYVSPNLALPSVANSLGGRLRLKHVFRSRSVVWRGMLFYYYICFQ